MPVRQMKLRFDTKPTVRVVPSLLVPKTPQTGKNRGNKEDSGGTLSAPLRGATTRPPSAAAKRPPAPGSG